MESRFKHKLSRMFRGSFGSCRTRNLSDVIEKSSLPPEEINHSFHMTDPIIPQKIRPFPSICRPMEQIDNNCIVSTMDVMLPRAKISSSSSVGATPFSRVDSFSGRSCSRASPDYFAPFSSSSLDSNLGGWWFSSEDEDRTYDEREDETETLFFSSKSLSSDSSEQRRRRRNRRSDKSGLRIKTSSDVGLVPLPARVKDSFAVVKKSSDPHHDFRTSMVEMIVEKQIFGAKDLEQLLQCFLSLNSDHHHRVIVEVFTEILEALFTNWGS
uniref:Transcription repressor n=1 Tax=Cannabis sativa TaxID=3483 RepID=A0A803NZJ3_CANSA